MVYGISTIINGIYYKQAQAYEFFVTQFFIIFFIVKPGSIYKTNNRSTKIEI